MLRIPNISTTPSCPVDHSATHIFMHSLSTLSISTSGPRIFLLMSGIQTTSRTNGMLTTSVRSYDIAQSRTPVHAGHDISGHTLPSAWCSLCRSTSSMRRMPGDRRGFYTYTRLIVRCGYDTTCSTNAKPTNKKGTMNNSWQPNHRQNVPTLSLHLPHPPPPHNIPRTETRTIILTTSHTPYGTVI
jgi:hypothetical protein